MSVLAVRVADPAATPVTGTLTLVALPGNVTLVGTVAAEVLLETRLKVNPEAGAGVDKTSDRFCVVVAVTVAVEGEKLMLALTVTGWLADVKPGADAVMVAFPKLMPVTCGCVEGVVAPGAITTLAGDIETLVLSLLERETVTPPAGAGPDRVTGNGADTPGPTDTFAGNVIPPITVTFAVASAILGEALTWITAEPNATAVTGRVAVVAPGANCTVAGTVATPVLLELTLTVRPPAGAPTGRTKVKF